ncbi:MAG: hypothetical protein GC131_03765 [Alphaproteobacteria bacterium]|nr:hypothetical protein [Alphaproteobacteria bacterium]
MDYHAWLGIAASLLAIPSYFFYIRNILRGRTKPHVFSWLVWTVMAGAVFLMQIYSGAGAGAWVTGLTLVACIVILVLALRFPFGYIKTIDWACLVLALGGFGLWLLLDNPVWGVALLSLATFASFAPTYRKGWHLPHEETSVTFCLDGTKYVLSLLAMQQLNIVTVFYPALSVLLNFVLVAMLLWRRQRIKP